MPETRVDVAVSSAVMALLMVFCGEWIPAGLLFGVTVWAWAGVR